MSDRGPTGLRRLYKEVDTSTSDAGVSVRLDGRIALTPRARPLVLPTLAAADLVAGEWADQGDRIQLSRMPATRLANTAIDAVADAPEATAAELGRYAGADMLCYFADAPMALRQRQELIWTPLLAWALEALELTFVTTSGIVHRVQPPETIGRVEALGRNTDPFTLAGLVFGAGVFGSAIIVLALRDRRLTADEAMILSRLDEQFQEDTWGVDAEDAARVAALAKDAKLLSQWFAALA